jgi:hypothetical protein
MIQLHKFKTNIVGFLLKIILSIFTIGLIFAPVTSSAQSTCQIYNPNLPDFGPNCVPILKNFQGNREGITAIILRVADYAIFVIGAIGVLMIIYAGFLFITDGGSGERATKGRKIIINVIVGIIITIASYTIVAFVTGFITTLDLSSASGTTGTNTTPGI